MAVKTVLIAMGLVKLAHSVEVQRMREVAVNHATVMSETRQSILDIITRQQGGVVQPPLNDGPIKDRLDMLSRMLSGLRVF